MGQAQEKNSRKIVYCVVKYQSILAHGLEPYYQNQFLLTTILPLIRSNSWNAQLVVPNDPRNTRLETNLGIGQVKEGNDTPYHLTSCGSSVSLQSKYMIEAFTTVSPHENTIVITEEIESGFVAKDNLFPFRCSPVS
ncbi:hypothetical protein TNCV_422871 [Trichonephila clavipes]|nr:hypothetical protein TNCV_422871 [Trichonephila clavipes]